MSNEKAYREEHCSSPPSWPWKTGNKGEKRRKKIAQGQTYAGQNGANVWKIRLLMNFMFVGC